MKPLSIFSIFGKICWKNLLKWALKKTRLRPPIPPTLTLISQCTVLFIPAVQALHLPDYSMISVFMALPGTHRHVVYGWALQRRGQRPR